MKLSQELYNDIFDEAFIQHCTLKLNESIDVPFINEQTEEKAIRHLLLTIKKLLGDKIVTH